MHTVPTEPSHSRVIWHGETINECLARFKATKNVFISHVGKQFDKLVKEDPSYEEAQKKSGDAVADLCAKVLEEAFTNLFMNNADQSKCGSLMARMNTAQSLQDSSECPKTLVAAHAALDAHPWDKEHSEKQKKFKEKKSKEQTSNEDEPLSLSFAQFK